MPLPVPYVDLANFPTLTFLKLISCTQATANSLKRPAIFDFIVTHDRSESRATANGRLERSRDAMGLDGYG